MKWHNNEVTTKVNFWRYVWNSICFLLHSTTFDFIYGLLNVNAWKIRCHNVKKLKCKSTCHIHVIFCSKFYSLFVVCRFISFFPCVLVCQNLNGVVSINVHNKLQAPFDFVCFKFIIESCSFWGFFCIYKTCKFRPSILFNVSSISQSWSLIKFQWTLSFYLFKSFAPINSSQHNANLQIRQYFFCLPFHHPDYEFYCIWICV